MKAIQFFLLVFITVISSLFGYIEEKDLLVTLETESPLTPVYLIPSFKQTTLSDAYVQQIEEILKFDLSHNGRLFISKKTPTNDGLGQEESKNLGNPASWKSQNIFYVMKLNFKENGLTASLLNVDTKILNTTDQFPLSGNLNQDRRQIHRLADLTHKAFFRSNGIASTKILYSQKGKNGKGEIASEIWEIDYDGANARQLTTEGSECINPIYIPPKAGFASGGFLYISFRLGQPKVFVSSFKNPKGSRLNYLGGSQLMPAISLQRDKIAFISDATGNPDLFLQPFSPEAGAIGKPHQIYSAKPATQGTPTFNPTGDKLAFVSNKDGSARIYIIDVPKAGSHSRDVKTTLISKINRENTAPCWSPDGTKIAYCSRHGGDRQIWVYDFTTKQERQITQGKGNKENPSWAPNSLHLVYNSAGNGSELFFINLNQVDPVKITGSGSSNLEEKRYPNWESMAG